VLKLQRKTIEIPAYVNAPTQDFAKDFIDAFLEIVPSFHYYQSSSSTGNYSYYLCKEENDYDIENNYPFSGLKITQSVNSASQAGEESDIKLKIEYVSNGSTSFSNNIIFDKTISYIGAGFPASTINYLTIAYQKNQNDGIAFGVTLLEHHIQTQGSIAGETFFNEKPSYTRELITCMISDGVCVEDTKEEGILNKKFGVYVANYESNQGTYLSYKYKYSVPGEYSTYHPQITDSDFLIMTPLILAGPESIPVEYHSVSGQTIIPKDLYFSWSVPGGYMADYFVMNGKKYITRTVCQTGGAPNVASKVILRTFLEIY
jgi:hypothetical protein